MKKTPAQEEIYKKFNIHRGTDPTKVEGLYNLLAKIEEKEITGKRIEELRRRFKISNSSLSYDMAEKMGFTVVEEVICCKCKRVYKVYNKRYYGKEQRNYCCNECTAAKEKAKADKGPYGIYGIYIGEELVYIGMTMRPFIERWKEHVRYAKNPSMENSQQPYLYKAMREAKAEVELRAIIPLDTYKTKRDVKCMEFALITAFKPKYNYSGVVVPYRW